FRISGTITNLDFLYNLATCRPFVEAKLDTGFIEQHAELIFHEHSQDLTRELPLAALALLLHKQQQTGSSYVEPWSPWLNSNACRLNEPRIHRVQLHYHQQDHNVEIEQRGALYKVRAAGEETVVECTLEGDSLRYEINGHRRRGTLAVTHDNF